MPQNGEINTTFGVYRNVCCGAEIVISKGVTFPDCPRHVKLPTEWKAIADDRIRQVSEVSPQKKTSVPAA